MEQREFFRQRSIPILVLYLAMLFLQLTVHFLDENIKKHKHGALLKQFNSRNTDFVRLPGTWYCLYLCAHWNSENYCRRNIFENRT
jgi:hypothetical protein